MSDIIELWTKCCEDARNNKERTFTHMTNNTEIAAFAAEIRKKAQDESPYWDAESAAKQHDADQQKIKEQTAKIAMLQDALTKLVYAARKDRNAPPELVGDWDTIADAIRAAKLSVKTALSATEQDVAKFIAEIEARAIEESIERIGTARFNDAGDVVR